MAKNKGGNKKSTAKKAAAPKVDAVEEKVETPIEGTNEGSGDYDPELPTSPGPADELHQDTSEDTQEEVESETEVETVTPDPEPEPEECPEPEDCVKEDAPVEDWKTRLYQEALDNKDKMVKLKSAIENKTVPTSEISILTEQYNAMHALAVIFNTRLGRM